MKKDINSIMLNPSRMRIVQVVASQPTITANDICEKIVDIPRTTLYRHINILIESNVLSVVDEKKVRGSLERTLALNAAELNAQNDGADMPQQALKFLLSIYTRFEKSFANINRTDGTNKVFLNNTVMMMDDKEFDDFLSELQSLLVKYSFDSGHGRKPRNIIIISAPPDMDGGEKA